VSGSIVKQEVDAIVSSDDEYLTMGGGVSMAIRGAAGPTLMDAETRKYVPVRPGRAVVTSAGELPARFVFHGVTLGGTRPALAQPNRMVLLDTVGYVTLGSTRPTVVYPSRDLIAEIMTSCFYHADSLHVKTIAFPLLGTGVGNLSRIVCLDTMFRFLARMLLRGVTSVCEARIVLYEDLAAHGLSHRPFVT
jgi:O-acetyl-ADP-ribose deacetylase (regulator of RNase III)